MQTWRHKFHCTLGHLTLLVRPLVIGVTLSAIWYQLFFANGIFLGKMDESAITNMVVPICAMFHSILAAMVLSKVWEEFKVVSRCIREEDRETFDICSHERIPGIIHVLLATMSIIIIVGAMLVEYENPLSGMFSVGCLSFFLVLYWEVATTLDNPAKAPWFIGRLPSDWL